MYSHTLSSGLWPRTQKSFKVDTSVGHIRHIVLTVIRQLVFLESNTMSQISTIFSFKSTLYYGVNHWFSRPKVRLTSAIYIKSTLKAESSVQSKIECSKQTTCRFSVVISFLTLVELLITDLS